MSVYIKQNKNKSKKKENFTFYTLSIVLEGNVMGKFVSKENKISKNKERKNQFLYRVWHPKKKRLACGVLSRQQKNIAPFINTTTHPLLT